MCYKLGGPMPFSTADHLEEESCVFCGFVDPRARATQPGSVVEVVGEEGLLWLRPGLCGDRPCRKVALPPAPAQPIRCHKTQFIGHHAFYQIWSLKSISHFHCIIIRLRSWTPYCQIQTYAFIHSLNAFLSQISYHLSTYFAKNLLKPAVK